MNEKFTQYFQEQGFKEPTLIQKEVYPLLQAGKNVLGLAPTGSGKTLANCGSNSAVGQIA